MGKGQCQRLVVLGYRLRVDDVGVDRHPGARRVAGGVGREARDLVPERASVEPRLARAGDLVVQPHDVVIGPDAGVVVDHVDIQV